MALVSARWLWLPDERPLADWSTEALLRWRLSANLALSLEARERSRGFEGQTTLLFYY